MAVSINLGAQEYQKQVFRIKFNQSADTKLKTMKIQKSADGIARTGFESVDRMSEKYGTSSIRRVFPYAGKFEAKHRKYGLHLWYEVVVDANADVRLAKEDYSKLSEISQSELILKKSNRDETTLTSGNGLLGSLPGGTNDPLYSQQWHYNNTGQSGGTVDADIDLPEAWAIQTGSSDVIVSVHDGGIDIDHEDLAGNIWVNEDEIPGNGIDDDGNGYVDDYNGYNFADGTGTIGADSHGTHVAGTIAAETNNGVGMSGIAGGTGAGDGVRLMSCECFGSVSSGGFAESYIYAADNGAVISQNSWGYTNPGSYEQAVLDAIDYFIAEAGKDELGNQVGPMAGGLVIFAAGNDGTDNEWYPGYYEPVMAVAGTDHNDNKYNNSNHGAWVELAAPAVNIYSTIPNDQYTGGYTGTSMACPHVSGTAALILSQFKDEGITPQQIWDRLVNSTDPLTFEGAEDWGSGRLNAFAALAEDDGMPPLAITDMSIASASAVSVTFNWTSPADQPDNYPATLYDFRFSTNPITAGNFDLATPYQISAPLTPGQQETVIVQGLTPGTTYYFAVKSADYFGNTSEISNTVMATTDLAPQIVTTGNPGVSVDININPIETGYFTIQNQGQADLLFNVFPVYLGRTNPQPLSTLIYPGTQVSIEPETNYTGLASLNSVPSTNNVTAGQLSFSNDAAVVINYDDGDDEVDGSIAVTAGGTPVVWSAATAFEVPDLGGEKFILSQVNAYLDASGGAAAKPSSLSIIKGGETPSFGELVMMQEFTNIIGAQFVTIPLEMPLSLNSGDKFWIVFNFPDEPLRLGYDDVTGGNRPGAYLAFFNGIWNDVQEIAGWENYVWTVRAIQTQLQGVSVDITQGTVGIGGSQNIGVTYDLTDATRNGDYNFNIFVLSNDPVTPVTKVEAKAVVTGIPEPLIAVDPQEVNSIIDASVNPVKTETLTIHNNGEGELVFDFQNPVVDQDVSIPAFTGEYPKGTAAPSLEKAPSVSAETSSNLPVAQLDATTAYAQEVYPNSYFVSFSTDNPTTYLTSSVTSYTAYAGDFAKGDDKHMYIVDKDASELKLLDIETGGLTTIGGTLAFTDLANDKNDGTMYGAYYTNPSSDLYTVDLETGATTLIGTMGSGIMIAIACDGDGNLWGLNLDDNIYSIDKSTGVATLVGSAGFDANYAQSMAWDPGSGIVYLSAYNNAAGRGELRILDTETGATELVGAFPGNAEVCAFGFPGGGSADFVSVNPTSGTVAPNSTATIEVQLDATVLPNGTYNSSLMVYSNDFTNPSVEVPVNLEVTGQVGEINISNVFVEFGGVFLNGEKELPIIIINTGIGSLEVSEITSNNVVFTTDLTEPAVIEMGDSLVVMAKFAPATLEQFNGILTINSNDPANPQVEITVTGIAVSPPVISLDPTQIEETLDAGQQVVRQFTILNEGLYPLQYSMPTVAAAMLLNNPDIQKNNTSLIKDVKQSADKELNGSGETPGYPVLLGAGGPDELGYSWIDSREEGGPVFVWEDISTTGTEILEDSDDGSVDIDLPFGFKFYGELKASITVSSNGYLTFGVDGTDYTNDQIPSTTDPNNYIAPFWDDMRPSSKRGQIFYQSYPDKFVVQYHEMGNYPSATTGTATFQVVLFPNGNIAYYYKDFMLENNASATIGVENEDGTIGLQVAYNTDYVSDSLAVLIFPGRTPFDVSVSTVAGIIQPNSQVVVDLTVDATDLIEGNYINELLISSNDPVNPEVTFTTKLDVIGHPEINVSPASIEFSSIFQTLSETRMLSIENTGSKDLTVSNISADNASFTVDFANPIMIAPTQTVDVEVTYTAINTGEVTGNITIDSDDEFGNQTVTVPVSGTGLIPPVMVVTTDPDPVDITMNSGDSDTIKVMVENAGGSPLDYVMVKPYYTNVGDVTVSAGNAPELTSKEDADGRIGNVVQYGSGGPDSFGYTWVDSDAGTEVVYDWMEISDVGTKLDLGGDDGVYVTLPFNFPFYNETYNQVQIASNGFFTFGDNLGSIGGYSNQDIPQVSAPNNLIAPLWDDLEPQDGDGVYMFSTPDYVIIQYNEVPAFLSTTTATFQAIIYANGSMKFQYKDVMNYVGVDRSTVGVENEDGTDALKVVFNNTYVKDGLAVLIKSPFVTGTVEPGTTANVDLVIDAANIYDGFYESPLKVLSNDPANPSIEIPTTLTVTGTPEIALGTDTLKFDNVYYVDGVNYSDSKVLMIMNDGTKALNISSMWLSNETAIFEADKSGAFVLEPKEAMVVNITFTPDAVGSFENTFNIASDDASQPVISVVMMGEAIEPPVMVVNPTDTLKLELLSTGSAVESSTVSNQGGSVMDYTANVVYYPGGFTEATQSAVFNRTKVTSPVFRALAQNTIVTQNSQQVLFDVDFKDSITYDPNSAPDDYYGYNGSAGYSSANRFIVTTETFTLTHITNYYQTNGATGSVIMEIYKGGTLPGQGTLLTSQAFTHAEAAAGANCLIELDQPIKFVQGDVFFVAMHYPMEINFPAAFNRGVSGVDGVSYWYDVNSSVWLNEDPGYVYKIRAFEAVGVGPTEWLTIDPTEGTLEAGTSNSHSVNVNAAATTGGYHYAKVVYSSNDPVTPSIEWPVQLYVNYLPEIVFAQDSLFVDEGQIVETMVVASDPEGGALTFEFAANYEFMEMTVSNDTARIVYQPDYEQAGIHDIVINVTDDKGETVEVPCVFVVNNVNRTPVLQVDMEDKMYFPTDPSETIDLNAYFADPDGQTMIYEVFAGSDTAFTVAVDGSLLEINPFDLGFGVVTVTATDPEGAYAVATFNVRVRHLENHAPLLTQIIPDQMVYPDQPAVLDLDNYFTDIDWDEIEYSFTISGRPSVFASLNGSVLTLERYQFGMCILTVYADDQRGGITAFSFAVFVQGRGRANNPPYQVAPIGDRVYQISQDKDRIHLTDFFADPDGDQLNFIGVLENGEAVEMKVEGSDLVLSPEALGQSNITIYVSDDRTPEVLKTGIAINVTEDVLGVDAEVISLRNYPNPVSDITTIEYQLKEAAKVRLEVLNAHGKTIELLIDENKDAGKYTIEYGVGNLSSGIYFYRLTVNEEQFTNRMIVK